MAQAQYAIRAQKTIGVCDGPSFEVTSKIPADTAAARTCIYSGNGEYLAYAHAESVHIVSTEAGSTVSISQPNVIALAFSPLASWLFTFERPIKSDTDVHKNVKAWDVKTGELVNGWYQKTMDDWEPVVTPDEAQLFRPSASDITIFSPPMAARPTTRLKVDGQIRGLFMSRPSELPQGTTSSKPLRAYPEPALAVWVGERKGAPATLALYTLSSLLGKPKAGDEDKTETRDLPMTVARKAFYKADKINLKWNNAGTMALFLTHTDVDNSGKSYYGETNLYLVSLDGQFEGMVDLDKEGPIYDFGWNPNSREFSVCYGYMPARTQVFDLKAKAVHSFGNAPRNFLLYQPQGKLLLSAGFGNLAGGVDIWDVSTRKKVAEFEASNSSYCEWSPCGRYFITATLSPRLRVDNGVKVWWCSGELLHVHLQDELYQASFRPQRIETLPPFPAVVPKAPEANASAAALGPKKDVAATNGSAPKSVGAYRPPGARGTLASDAYRRDDDSAPSSGASTPLFRGGKPGARYIPGAPIPGAAAVPGTAAGGEKKKRQRTKNKKAEGGSGAATPAEDAPAADLAKLAVDEDAAQKKIRNLTKKLKAIDDLKARIAKGEQLEKTQMQKIDTEAEVRSEIKTLGG